MMRAQLIEWSGWRLRYQCQQGFRQAGSQMETDNDFQNHLDKKTRWNYNRICGKGMLLVLNETLA